MPAAPTPQERELGWDGLITLDVLQGQSRSGRYHRRHCRGVDSQHRVGGCEIHVLGGPGVSGLAEMPLCVHAPGLQLRSASVRGQL